MIMMQITSYYFIKIIITGDLNKLNIRNLLFELSFAQLVKSPTRGENILDVFITNAPTI
jgi:hypothetical protein